MVVIYEYIGLFSNSFVSLTQWSAHTRTWKETHAKRPFGGIIG